jgi:hypothetical protein
MRIVNFGIQQMVLDFLMVNVFDFGTFFAVIKWFLIPFLALILEFRLFRYCLRHFHFSSYFSNDNFHFLHILSYLY